MAGEQLRVTEGKARGARLSVDADLLIGRMASDDEGRLGEDAEISRRHAYVSRGSDGRLTIEDLGSANGTFVNDERIDAPVTLEAGDVVRVGKTVLEVTDASGVVPETSPSVAGAPATELAVAPSDLAVVLVATAGPLSGRRLALGDELMIGREVSGEGKLGDDPKVSRRHARVARDASGRLTIEDLGSANGTFVNGERMRGLRVLAVGDSVQIGSTTLEVTEVGPAPAAPVAPAAPPPVAVQAPPPPSSLRPPAPAAPASGELGLTPVLPLGAVFAGCRVEEVIGHGAMGVVYRAEELALQRPVALKLILAEHSQHERFRERFRRESQITAAIDHPNVIPIFDAGDEDGVLYIMMRLVEGTDLRAVIETGGRLEPLRAARIVRQVGAALDAAHACGMLHRDIKPSNVLLARDDHVYLSDFGLAKRADAAGGMTRHGTVVARAGYVAPEQILNERVDARADVYTLGCLLFEALTAEAPFAREGAGPLAHVNAPPPSPLDLRPDLPPAFDQVVGRAMAKDPSERYPSAGDLGQAALVAAGGLRRASPWSVVATGEAAFLDGRTAEPPADAAPVPGGAAAGGSDAVRWAIALAGLAIVAAGMVAALIGISSL
jgi:pSer/pThr/pTyr-binding forkhead associated (FHA) protein/tRNA A-37 threonylcarbamoyl transferase component Bud32